MTGPTLVSPVLVAVRWQTKYPRRSPMRGRHWQLQVAKSPRPVFPAYQVNRRSAVLLLSCSGKATHWRFGLWQSLRCQGELLPGARSRVAFARSSFQNRTGQALLRYPANRIAGSTVAGSRPEASLCAAGPNLFPVPSAIAQCVTQAATCIVVIQQVPRSVLPRFCRFVFWMVIVIGVVGLCGTIILKLLGR